MLPRIGFGYDVHRLSKGYELWLGGLKLDFPLGAVGHSDADVLLHAIHYPLPPIDYPLSTIHYPYYYSFS